MPTASPSPGVGAPDPDDLRTRPAAALWSWWSSARARLGRTPSRADLDPEHLKAVLPHLFIAEAVPGPDGSPAGFRFRLYGTFVGRTLGRDATGREIDASTFGPAWLDVLELYRRVAATGEPLRTIEEIRAPAGHALRVEVLHVPLAPPGSAPDMVLGSFDVAEDDALGWSARRPADRSELLWTVRRRQPLRRRP